MKDMHHTKKGPGRYAPYESVKRHEEPTKEHVRDFAGAKIARKALRGELTKRH